MAIEKVYPKGIMFFNKNEKAPNFVRGTVVISPNELFAWLKENQQFLKPYKETKQIRLQLLDGDKGAYFVVDTFEPKKKESELHATTSEDDLPF